MQENVTDAFVAKVDAFAATLDPEEQAMLIELLGSDDEVSGFTVLMLAAGNGHERVVELLLRRGAKVNQQSSDGLTALTLAATQGHERVVDMLLRHGAEDLQNSGAAPR